jgi:hypothetical protein
MTGVTVTDTAARSRYAIIADWETASVTYTRHGNRIMLIHTELPHLLGRRHRYR